MTLAATLLVEGCWHAPTAHTQPAGPPRLIAEGIVVESSRGPVPVRSELTVFVSNDRTLQLPGASGRIVGGARVLEADPSYRLLTLEFSDGKREVFKVNQRVKLGQIEPGDDVAIRTIGVIEPRPSSR